MSETNARRVISKEDLRKAYDMMERMMREVYETTGVSFGPPDISIFEGATPIPPETFEAQFGAYFARLREELEMPRMFLDVYIGSAGLADLLRRYGGQSGPTRPAAPGSGENPETQQ